MIRQAYIETHDTNSESWNDGIVDEMTNKSELVALYLTSPPGYKVILYKMGLHMYNVKDGVWFRCRYLKLHSVRTVGEERIPEHWRRYCTDD